MNLIEKVEPKCYYSYCYTKGIYKSDNNYIKSLSIKNFNSKKLEYVFRENKTPYYVLMFDLDFKELFEGVDNNVIIKDIINVIDKCLKEFIVNPTTNYVYANKNKGEGVHLYYPNIIVDSVLHMKIYNKCCEYLSNKSYHHIVKKILDESVCKNSSIRLFYNVFKGSYYYPNYELSTYKFNKDMNKHFDLCFINTDNTSYNFNLTDIYLKEIEEEKNITDNSKMSAYINKYVSDDVSKLLFFRLVDILDDDRWDNYNDWFSLICLFKTYGYYDEIVEYSKKSNKYNNSSLKIIDDVFQKTTDNTIKIGSLVYWARNDNPTETTIILYSFGIGGKMNIKHTNDILLKNTNNKDYSENSKYISENAVKSIIQNFKDNKSKCVILHSGTGSGKTTTINNLIKNLKDDNTSICCLTSRRTMIGTYENALKQVAIFDNYLDKRTEDKQYFISSLEYLPNIDRSYDIVILDEITSLLRHYYSDTMEGSRNNSFKQLLQLLNEAKYIICSDAIITDYVFDFFKTIEIDVFYYNNEYRVNNGKKMIIYKNPIKNDENKLVNFILNDKLKKDIINGRSVIIFSDSKKITELILLELLKINKDPNYYLLINSENTNLETIINCNETFLNKCVICSPRIIYGLDIQIIYEDIYCIYKNSNNNFGMGVLEYHQQINRCRNSKNTHILFLDNGIKTSNCFIPFDIFKQIEIDRYNNYSFSMRYNNNIINDLSSITRGIKRKFDTLSTFASIHFLKSWYDEVFSRNKLDVIKMLALESGYSISDKILKNNIKCDNKIIKKDHNDFIEKKNEKMKDIIDKVCQNKISEVKKNKDDLQLLDKVLSMTRFLEIKSCKNIDVIAKDEKLFNRFKHKIWLDLDYKTFIDKKKELDKKDIILISKDNKIISKIDTLFELERLLIIKRYDIENIKCDDIDIFKKSLNKMTEELSSLYNKNACKKTFMKMIENKIEKIDDNDDVKKFMADCYNLLGEFIKIDETRPSIDGKRTILRNYSKIILDCMDLN